MHISTSRNYKEAKVTTRPDEDGNTKTWYFTTPEDSPYSRRVSVTSYDRDGNFHGDFDDYDHSGSHRLTGTYIHGLPHGLLLSFYTATDTRPAQMHVKAYDQGKTYYNTAFTLNPI